MVSWDHLPIIRSYVKQQLGVTPTPTTSIREQIAATESPITQSVPPALANMSIAGPDVGEHWDPNKAVDKLKSGVMHKVREQKAQKRMARKERPQKPPLPILGATTTEIQIDEGTTPQ